MSVNNTTLVELNIKQISTILYFLDESYQEQKNYEDSEDKKLIEEVFEIMNEAADQIEMEPR